MGKPKQIEKEKQLIVEGLDELHFFIAMLKHLEITDVQVHSFDGKDKLRGFLGAFVNAPEFSTTVQSLGVVRDVENEPANAFQSVQDALKSAGLPVPARVNHPISEGSLQVTALLLPDDTTTDGTFDDLCLRTVADNPIMVCVDEYLECLEGLPTPSPRNRKKARIQAFLAGIEEPSIRLPGEAAKHGCWPWESPAVSHVIDFVKSL